MQKWCLLYLVFPLFSLLSSEDLLRFDTDSPRGEEEAITADIRDISIFELLRFVSKVAEVNFLYDESLPDFKISLMTGKETTSENIVQILIELLRQKGMETRKQGECYLIEANERVAKEGRRDSAGKAILPARGSEREFYIYKLQNHQGSEIRDAIQKMGGGIQSGSDARSDLAEAIQSMQWMESTNSLFYSGQAGGIEKLTSLINSLDVPKKQVFIEVLVIETDVKNGLDFGLEWGGEGRYKDAFRASMGNFPFPQKHSTNLIDALRGNGGGTPLRSGFNLGIIGDVISHGGATFFSIGSLVSALQGNKETTIILNQKIITQDNKRSSIFVGDTIPFTGSTVKTIGASEQISANVDYRDVGVKLNITPLLGDGEMITLDISEEITEVVDEIHNPSNGAHGIQTTKTDMNTQVHVPNESFLVLSGIMRNTKKNHKTGIPCLGNVPLIGMAFSKKAQNSEKRNVIVFVHPRILHTTKDHIDITADQEALFKERSGTQKEFESDIETLKRRAQPSDIDPSVTSSG